MAKKRGKTEGGEELIAGLPLKSVQEFLCHHEGDEWFNFGWLDTWRFARGEDKAERSRALERLTREMLARRWIEKVLSKSTAQRYKLTVSGRHYAAECRHLFKWPAAQSRIRPADKYSGRLRCLIHLHNELSRVGMTTLDLSQVQQFFLGDLAADRDHPQA